MVMRTPERKRQQPGSYYNPFVPPNLPTYPAQPMPAVPSARMPQLSPQPAVPSARMPQLSPQPAVPSVPMPQFGQGGVAAPQRTPAAKVPLPKKMNTQTNTEFDDVMQRNAARAGAQQIPPMAGDPPKDITETFPEYNKRVMRHRMGGPAGPARSTVRRSASPSSPSDAMQPRQRDYFGEQAVEGSLDQLGANSRSSILPTESPQRDFYDRTGTTPLFTPGLMQAAPTRVPVAPGVNEELLSRLPSRSERDRSTMQPGGMVGGSTFDAMYNRDKAEEKREIQSRIEGMINQTGTQNLHPIFRTPNVYAYDNRGFTRTVETDPTATKMVDGKRVSAYGDVKVVGDPMFGPTVQPSVQKFIEDGDNLNSVEGRRFRSMLNESREPRRKARLAGEVYTDPNTGAVSDYGKFNEAREARQERKDAARELRTRAAQIQAANSGRIGGVTVDPSGGIAGPQHVGTQGLYGQMGRGAAIAMAQNEMNREERASDALRKVERQQSIQNRLQAAQAMQDGPEKDAVLKQINDDILQPSDSAQVKPTPASARAKAERQVQLNDAQQRQADEITENPTSFYDDQMVALEGLETDEELDAYFNSEEGGVVYTPEQLVELNEQQILGLDQQLQNLGREGARQAGRSAGQFFYGPIGGFLGGLAGEYLMPNEGIGFTFGEEEIKEKRATLERHNKKLKEYIARRNQR